MTTVEIPPGPIDPYLRALRDPGTTFLLRDGRYQTRGCFGFSDLDFCMLAPGCSLVGMGVERSFISVESPILEYEDRRTEYFEALTGGARSRGESSCVLLSDFTISMGFQRVPSVGIHLWTSRASVKRVAVDRVWGDRDHAGPVKEGFGILINSSHAAAFDGGHIVEDCGVSFAESARENYGTGIFIGCVRRSVPMLGSRVRGATLITLGSSTAHAAIAGNDDVQFSDIRIAGRWVRAFFCDTGPVRRVDVSRVVADTVQWALDVRVAQPGDVREQITIRDSQFYFAVPTSGGWVQALLAADESGPAATPIQEIVFENCRFDARGIPLASAGRTRGPAVGPVVMRNCQWVGAWQSPIQQMSAKPWSV